MFKKKREEREGRDNKKEGKGARGHVTHQKRMCRFCSDNAVKIDYKDERLVSHFVTERGKILPRRYTGACAKHQRDITNAVKRARILAVIPFSSTQIR